MAAFSLVKITFSFLVMMALLAAMWSTVVHADGLRSINPGNGYPAPRADTRSSNNPRTNGQPHGEPPGATKGEPVTERALDKNKAFSNTPGLYAPSIKPTSKAKRNPLSTNANARTIPKANRNPLRAKPNPNSPGLYCRPPQVCSSRVTPP